MEHPNDIINPALRKAVAAVGGQAPMAQRVNDLAAKKGVPMKRPLRQQDFFRWLNSVNGSPGRWWELIAEAAGHAVIVAELRDDAHVNRIRSRAA